MGYDMSVKGAAANTEHDYLRRNIFGMHPTVEAMVGLEMAFWSPSPEFPKSWPDYSDCAHWDAEGEPVSGEARGYQERIQRLLATHGECRTPGIPSHKFTSNDGWHVTREECEQALEIYEKALANGRAHPEFFRDDVIPFLRCAAKHDGFEVW